MKNKFLKTDKTHIIHADGQRVFLRGVNFGGWLMKEAYFLHAPNEGEHKFKAKFVQELGAKAYEEFNQAFRGNFIKKSDFDHVAELGFNCIRLPFHYNLLEPQAGFYSEAGLDILDDVLDWAGENRLYVILDMHAVPGAQNADWHSDSTGEALFWKNADYRRRALDLWKMLAGRYKDKEYLAGYDVLNETVWPDAKALNGYYHDAIAAIRSVDQNHIIFLEGNTWATDVACLDQFEDDNYALSIHSYEPLSFTFNFVPHLRYPGRASSNATLIQKHLAQYKEISDRRQVPVLVGEFGVNYRDGLYGEDQWLEDNVKCFEQFDFHWTYWTYKAVKNSTYPDGIHSYYDNPPWVNREGPRTGWETYHLHWNEHKKEMAESWQSKYFRENTKVLKVLQKYAR